MSVLDSILSLALQVSTLYFPVIACQCNLLSFTFVDAIIPVLVYVFDCNIKGSVRVGQ